MRSFDHPLVSELLADRRPLVLPLHQFIPVVFGDFPGNKFPQRRDIQHDAIVQIWREVEVRSPLELIVEVVQFGEQVFLLLDLAFQLLRRRSGVACRRKLTAQVVQAQLLQPDFRLDVVDQRLEQDVFIQPVIVQPQPVVLLARLQQPVDRRFAA